MMEREALLRNILDELADYGKYKGTALLGEYDYIPVRAAQRIVRQNFKGIRYGWKEADAGRMPAPAAEIEENNTILTK